MKAKTKEAVLRELILQSTQTICTPDDIIRALNKSGTHAKHTEIVRVLAQLVDEGYLMRARSNRYGKPEAFGCAAGTFCATGRGYAFVRPENGHLYSAAQRSACMAWRPRFNSHPAGAAAAQTRQADKIRCKEPPRGRSAPHSQ